MINIPPEIGLKYPKPDTVAWVDSEEFVANEPKNFKVENCPYTWNIFREYPDELGNRAINNAYIINPSGRLREDGKFFSTPKLPKKLRKVLQLKDAFVSNAESKLQKVKKKFKNQEKEFIFVGIHSRRTDHLAYQHKRGQIPLQPSYYLGTWLLLSKISGNPFQFLKNLFFQMLWPCSRRNFHLRSTIWHLFMLVMILIGARKELQPKKEARTCTSLATLQTNLANMI